jgi:predicted transcriptional regulator
MKYALQQVCLPLPEKISGWKRRMPRTKPFSMRWDDELIEDIRHLAAEEERTFTQYVERVMRDHVARIKDAKKRKKKGVAA